MLIFCSVFQVLSRLFAILMEFKPSQQQDAKHERLDPIHEHALASMIYDSRQVMQTLKPDPSKFSVQSIQDMSHEEVTGAGHTGIPAVTATESTRGYY